jgi:hypothetical protein
VRVQITLKSGAQVTVNVARFALVYDGPNDRITGVNWKHDPAGGDLLSGIVRSEIAAAVLLDAPPPSVADTSIGQEAP